MPSRKPAVGVMGTWDRISLGKKEPSHHWEVPPPKQGSATATAHALHTLMMEGFDICYSILSPLPFHNMVVCGV